MLKPLFPVLDYAVNYDYISTELCVNKTQPELHCNGKCYLSKELAKSSQEDTSPFSKTKNQPQKVLDFYLPAEISEIQIVTKEFYTSFFFIYKADYSYLFLKHIFRPPIF
ncbi:hypothetical protein [Chryseobacterium sp. POL2]|uniref:hypothetical protein n=1 Tax=Chryseobacterium sp. POL2 TaxID=2713414 RepID=UPI00162A2520|nr:hypothetical protein [Chryseobacterium sp. POL2]